MTEKNAKIAEVLAANNAHAEERHAENLARASALREQAAQIHSERMRRLEIEAQRLDNSESVRTFVRGNMAAQIEEANSKGIPLDELLLANLNYVAGALAVLDLDEPADLKIRRLGRTMQAKPIIF